MAQKNILMVCGEPSGDLHAANLVRALKRLNPALKISAVGGPLLSQEDAKVFYPIKDLAVLGLFDVLRKLPKFFALKKLILKKISQEKPEAIILVDFSGFNLRLAKAIKKKISVIYYISPQVWASRPGRIKTIKKYISKMLVFFKFEQDFYKKYGIAVDFVGHPLLDVVSCTMEKKEFLNKFGLSESRLTIVLLPGSRKQETKNILPIMLEASLLINKKIKDTQFVIAKSADVDSHIYNGIINNIDLDIKIIEGKTYDCLKVADFCLVASGTATLETAIIERPFCVIYKMNPLNYFLYRWQIRVPYISMVNIMAQRKIIPEFIQFKARPQKIAEEAIKLLTDPAKIERMKNDLLEFKSLLGEKGASRRAAQIINNFL